MKGNIILHIFTSLKKKELTQVNEGHNEASKGQSS